MQKIVLHNNDMNDSYTTITTTRQPFKILYFNFLYYVKICNGLNITFSLQHKLIDIFNFAYVINLIKSDHKYVNDQIKNML